MKTLSRKILLIGLGLALLLAGVTACQTRQEKAPAYAMARFYLEADVTQTGAEWQTAVLPVSQVEIPLPPKPLLTEKDFAAVELVQVDLGLCLLFRLIPEKAPLLYEATGRSRGKRLVLKVNGRPLGVRLITEGIYDGNLFTFVEVPDPELAKLAKKLQAFIQELQRLNEKTP